MAVREGTTFSSDETADISEDTAVDLIEDVGSVTRTRQGDPLAGTDDASDDASDDSSTRFSDVPTSVLIGAGLGLGLLVLQNRSQGA